MATPQVVITNATSGTPAIEGIFAGLSFFLVQRVPSRSSFLDKIQANGGRIVKLEAQSDYVIADHYRKDAPTGSVSYTFIDAAIRDGVLPNPKDHLAGAPPGTIRQPGSALPGKGTRTAFTAEDDRVLWHWVERCRAEGGLVKGNEIYNQLEAVNNRHTSQSWRDRYIKKLMDRWPAGVGLSVAANAPPSPPHPQHEAAELPAGTRVTDEPEVPVPAEDSLKSSKSFSADKPQSVSSRSPIWPELADDARATATVSANAAQEEDDAVSGSEDTNDSTAEEAEFTNDDFEMLLKQAKDIQAIQPDRVDDAWDAWAGANPHHSAQSWRKFYHEVVSPEYRRRRKAEKQKRRSESRQPEEADLQPTHITMAPVQGNLADGLVESQVMPQKPNSSGSPKRKRSDAADELRVSKKARASNNTNASQGQPVEDQGSSKPAEQRTHTSPPKPSTQVIEITSDDSGGNYSGHDDNEDVHAESAVGMSDIERPSEDDGLAMSSDHIIQTSDLNRQAHSQLLQDAFPRSNEVNATDAAEDKEPSATEEMFNNSTSAQARFDEKVLGIPYTNVPSDDAVEANFLTSEVNREADQQVRRESLEPEEDSEDESQSALPILEALSAQLLRENPSDIQHRIPQESLHPSADALTEANLANQQAQHQAQLTRGVDLPRDDDERDGEQQEDFVKYLRNILPSSSVSRPPQENTKAIETTEADLPADAMFRNDDVWQHDETADIPLSSQQEIDDALESAINWPESPKQPRAREEPSQSLQFETQISYPALPKQSNLSQHHSLPMLSSQERENQRVYYPDLPTHSEEVVEALQIPNAVEQSSAPIGNCPDIVEHGSSYVLVDERLDALSSPVAENIDDIDLSILEPNGGWEVSSPPRLRVPQPAEARRSSYQEPGTLPMSGSMQALRNDQASEDASSESSSSSSEDSLEQVQAAPINRRGLETQDIINAETQMPDFDMPLPPDSDDISLEGLPSDPREQPSSPPNAATSESQRNLAHTQKLPDEDLEMYVDTMVVRGFKESSIIDALKHASMRPDLAELVLLEEKAGKGLPQDVAGIWSEEEDRMLESGNARDLKKLDAKHGDPEMMARLEFLSEWRDDEEEEEL